MDVKLEGKKVLITGGTRGIGRAIAVAFAEAGADLVINFASNQDAASETYSLLSKYGRFIRMIKGDASNPEFGADLVQQGIDSLGHIDILVNNAGVSHNTPFLMLEPEEWKRAVDVNVNTLFSITQPVLKHMISKKIAGRVLNLTSLCGVRPVAAVPVHYAATKAAITGFTYTLAKEVGRYGITVNAIAPGLIETAFSVNLPETRKEDFNRFCPLGRIGKPEEVAHLAVFMVSDLNSYMTGETVIVSGGL
ncbi:MAG: SDR family oxidoreductase [Candidatus Riflebacteria bacterium]|nr:SDR family oxidoreductase [Candidatus Riflebacteria bacterium]